MHRANPLPVDAIGALETQINQLQDFAEVLRRELDATSEDRDRWRERAQRLMLELKVSSGLPWWKRLTGYMMARPRSTVTGLRVRSHSVSSKISQPWMRNEPLADEA